MLGVILNFCRACAVIVKIYRSFHFADDIKELFVKYLAAALDGVSTINIDSCKTCHHSHSGCGVAIYCGFHGYVVFRELVAGLSVIGVAVNSVKLYFDTKFLKLGLDKLCITYVGFLACINSQGKADNVTFWVDVKPSLFLSVKPASAIYFAASSVF